MPAPPTLARRFLGLCATSLTALCLPVLDYQLHQSRTIRAHGDYIIYLTCMAIFAILWPLSTARSLSRIQLKRSWILATVVPYGIASLAVAALVLAGRWSAADSLSFAASLAIQAALIPIYLWPRKPSPAVGSSQPA